MSRLGTAAELLHERKDEKHLSPFWIQFRIETPALQSWTFGADYAKRIQQPLLYIGAEDSAKYFEIHQLMSSWFPHMEEIMLPKTTHMPHMMNPELVVKGLGDFSRH